MTVLKAFGKVYGAELTAAERKGMQIEIRKELAEWWRAHLVEVDALVLWSIHKQLGYGPKRLRDFFDDFVPEMNALLERYEMDDTDRLWLCTHLLKETLGVDVEQWQRENENKYRGE